MKMLKYLLALLVIGAVNGQGGELSYFVDFDPNFIVSWGLNSTTDTITIQIYADTTGWAMLKILSPSGGLLDVWWLGYDQDRNTTYIQDGNAQLVGMDIGSTYPDTLQNLEVVAGSQPPSGVTRIRFRRSYDTGDRADVPFLHGRAYTVIWGYAADDAPQSPAVKGGFGTITWRPADNCTVDA